MAAIDSINSFIDLVAPLLVFIYAGFILFSLYLTIKAFL